MKLYQDDLPIGEAADFRWKIGSAYLNHLAGINLRMHEMPVRVLPVYQPRLILLRAPRTLLIQGILGARGLALVLSTRRPWIRLGLLRADYSNIGRSDIGSNRSRVENSIRQK
ncbi:MAG: hypothetical protein M1281_14945 [Chloroflexi bacterium]|nr:hypothetical protein [Chloroflexota bacterium]